MALPIMTENEEENSILPYADFEDEGEPTAPPITEKFFERVLDVDEQVDQKLFSREDILGNLTRWDVERLEGLLKLELLSDRVGISGKFFRRLRRARELFSRAVNMKQQEIVRTSIQKIGETERKEPLLERVREAWGWK